jgi:shikimate dehydrogenase
MGHPIAHSKSPFIHGAFAKQTGQSLRYEAICVALDGFAQAVAAFRKSGGRGLNVTLPFKEEAFAIADSASERATVAGAANTLCFDTDGACRADNKATPFVRWARRSAAAACVDGLGMLVEQAAESVFLWRGVRPRTGEVIAALEGRLFDVLVNATSASLRDEVPDVPTSIVAEGGCCYDMMYAAEATPFVRWARRSAAAACVDGLGMLVEQAAESFFLWRGVRPRTGEVIAALREQLSVAG